MKKVNKRLLAPLTISLLAITLAGCNDEDNGIFGSGNSNEFTITSFDSSYDNQANANAVARIDETYRTGEREIKVRNIVNNYRNLGINDLDKTVLADNFEGRLENKNIEVNRRTIKRPVYENNSNNKFDYETTYQALDLSGVIANSYNDGNTLTNSNGIRTDLNNYPRIATDASFPVGSVCYIPVTTSERLFLAFNAKNETIYQTLDDWIEVTEERFNDNRKFSTTKFRVGSGNDERAAKVEFFEAKNQPAYLYSGVDYKGDIYEVDYVTKGATNPNTDSRRGVVDCTLVNDVAGDFLAEQIERYY
ncbi:hypothetical protein [Psychrobacter sp. P11G5]|uniref:hypothetical protein n=1 Tax=Psychrobacter sp. P11G5 TaxID=1699624 RepID=UPI00078CE580|nr:hypothetical protein [Psychrobacter sp. P11G5]AMN66721.1 hypothetical protein AK825_02445 [Psychrobacter sp. P11G5]